MRDGKRGEIRKAIHRIQAISATDATYEPRNIRVEVPGGAISIRTSGDFGFLIGYGGEFMPTDPSNVFRRGAPFGLPAADIEAWAISTYADWMAERQSPGGT